MGHLLKKIASGWNDFTATEIAKIIMIKWYDSCRWEQFWMEKPDIHRNFWINVFLVALTSCNNF
jgi:hypothetical protein